MTTWLGVTNLCPENNATALYNIIYCKQQAQPCNQPKCLRCSRRFNITPNNYWETIKTDDVQKQKIVDWLAQQLDVKSVDDWCRVSMKQVRCWIDIESNVFWNLLESAYPTHNWTTNKMGKSGALCRASQRALVIAMGGLFPNQSEPPKLRLTTSVLYEEHKHSELTHPSSGQPLEFDVFAPGLNLALEYQGEQHYQRVFPFSSDTQQQQRDKEKRQACTQVFILQE